MMFGCGPWGCLRKCLHVLWLQVVVHINIMCHQSTVVITCIQYMWLNSSYAPLRWSISVYCLVNFVVTSRALECEHVEPCAID